MCALPAKLIDRVHRALELHKCSDAELILMQAAPTAGDANALFENLCARADELTKSGAFDQAESLYTLAIELCQECIPNGHHGIFAAVRKLGLIYIRSEREEELSEMIDKLQPLLLKTAKALGEQHIGVDTDVTPRDSSS